MKIQANVWLYTSITVHYIAANRIFHRCLITFFLLEYPHTGAKIGSTTVEKFREYNIEQKNYFYNTISLL